MRIKSLARYGCFSLAILLTHLAHAQTVLTIKQPYLATPAHMWELGLSSGIAMNFGDMAPQLGAGGGVHLRKALDYVFSIRGDFAWSQLNQENKYDGESNTSMQYGSLQFLISLNNLSWSTTNKRKANLYGFVGGGVNRFKVNVTKVLSPYLSSVSPTFQTHVDGGFGIAFRLSNRFNLGVETKMMFLFGHDNDLLDGVDREEGDVMSYTSLRFNLNIGNNETKAEPLYWLNPMATMAQDISELKNRPAIDLTDSDGDGVVDQIDQDKNTPVGAEVDTRGIPLDSDGDGIPNYLDEEPYLPVGNKIVRQNEEDKPNISEDDVRRIVQEELERIARENEKVKENRNTVLKKLKEEELDFPYSDGIANWFLPIIHFNIDSYKVRHFDYGNLASVARLMTANPSLRLVVTGFTDKTASDQYNQTLSHRRASAVVDYLVHVHGISRSRLIIQYNGEDAPLVPSLNSTIMNRRVEFRAATPEDVEMEDPLLLPEKSGN